MREDVKKVLFDEEQLSNKVRELGKQIVKTIKERIY